mgnify:CR=1 FL=1
MDAEREVAPAGIEVDRHRLVGLGPELEHLADAVDDERVGLPGLLDAEGFEPARCGLIVADGYDAAIAGIARIVGHPSAADDR